MLRKRQKKDHSPALFLPRKNDFLRTDKQNQPLKIDRQQIIRPAHEVSITGGSATYGPYFVKRKPASKEKLYYISNHAVDDEYFALELLQYIGINTPKLRVTSGSFQDSAYHSGIHRRQSRGIAAVKSMDGYIPMFILLTGIKGDAYLDIPTQRIVLKDYPQETFKISGQVFASFIAACLIDDSDFGFEDINFGMIRVGNRYYSAAIDKDCAQFNDAYINRILFRTLKIFKSVCLDQELFIISRLQQGLKNDASGICDFDRIFQNSRTQSTPEIAAHRLRKCVNLKARAQNIINLYLKKNPDCMHEFHQREVIRQKIAAQVLDNFNVGDDQAREVIRNIILEDLRGPYYLEYFILDEISKKDMKNVSLLNVMTHDISKEFPELANAGHRFSRK